MSRRELRENLFKMLFRIEFFESQELPEQVEAYFEETACIDEKDRGYIRDRFNAILEKHQEIDELINTAAKGWKTSRMGKVDLTIIRLAVYEMKFDEDVPVSVAINEAVELAKKFGTDDSGAFVNGVLAKIA